MKKLYADLAGLVLPALVGAAFGYGGGYLQFLTQSRDMDIRMVQIAIGILSAEPKENVAPAREWAVDVIDQYSRVKVSPAARTALVNYKIENLGDWGLGTAAAIEKAKALGIPVFMWHPEPLSGPGAEGKSPPPSK